MSHTNSIKLRWNQPRIAGGVAKPALVVVSLLLVAAVCACSRGDRSDSRPQSKLADEGTPEAPTEQTLIAVAESVFGRERVHSVRPIESVDLSRVLGRSAAAYSVFVTVPDQIIGYYETSRGMNATVH
jgi:hypothetical protein